MTVLWGAEYLVFCRGLALVAAAGTAGVLAGAERREPRWVWIVAGAGAQAAALLAAPWPAASRALGLGSAALVLPFLWSTMATATRGPGHPWLGLAGVAAVAGAVVPSGAAGAGLALVTFLGLWAYGQTRSRAAGSAADPGFPGWMPTLLLVVVAAGGAFTRALENLALDELPPQGAALGEYRAVGLLATALVCSLVCLALIVSERKRVERVAGSASEERLRSLFESAPDGVVVFDAATGEILLVNPVLGAMLGRTPDELLGTPVTRRTLAAALGARALGAHISSFPFGEDRLRRSDGEDFYVDSTGTFLEYGGRRCVLAFVRDVTERRRAAQDLEAQRGLLRAVLDNTDNGLLALDAAHRVVFYNEQYVRSFGTPRELLDSGASLEDLLRWACRHGLYPPDREEELVAGRSRALEGPEDRRAIETPRADGVVMEGFQTRLPGGGHLLAFRDVTERKRIEDALRAAKEFSESLVGNSPVAMFVLDVGHRVLFWNRACEELTGLPASEVIGTCRHWSAFYASERPCLADLVIDGRHAEAANHYPESGRSVLAPNGLRAEGWYPRLGGRDRYIAFDAAPLYDQGGALVAAVETLQDLSGRKRAEEAARHSLSLLRSTLESTAEGVLVVDRSGRVVLWNQRFRAMWGLPDVPLASEGGPGLLRTVSSHLRAPDAFLQSAAALSEEPEAEGFDVVEASDGRVIERYSIPQRLDGAAVGRVWSFRDVTGRERARQELARLAAAVEQTAEAIVVADADGTVQYVNPAFEQITGYGRDEVCGRSHPMLRGGGGSEGSSGPMTGSLTAGEVWKSHRLNRRKDGTPYEEETTVSPVRDAGGQIVNYVAVTRDVTHEVELQRRLSQSQKLEALGTLSGGIAHDFNNILAAILGFTEMTRDDLPAGSRDRDNLDRVVAAAVRARDLVRQILAFSRPSAEQREPIRVAPLVEETATLLRGSLPPTIEIRQELRSPQAAVVADETQLHQVLLNLCANAGHAMGAKGGTLTVTLDEVEAQPEGEGGGEGPRRWVELSVSDTGPGVPREIRDRIFEPFFTTKDVGEGTGMGLSVAHGIATSHGGTIDLESRPGHGATFRVRLPAVEPGPEPGGQESPAAAAGQGRLLFVDDEEALVELAAQSLGNLGYQVTALSDSRAALERFREDPSVFDLLVTDQAMPGLSGGDLTRAVRSIRPDLPVILCTGGGLAAFPEGAELVDLREVVTKPFSLGTLAAAVGRALARDGGYEQGSDEEARRWLAS
ncbi:MAG: PAS domain S-box protein [Deltaproteobacteria bacterium]|nr:PAS domain S-box protein [Deltaproteobacteria bacterium]